MTLFLGRSRYHHRNGLWMFYQRSRGVTAMCLAVYVASNHVLATVPWDPAHPGFYVVDATENFFYPSNPLRVHFQQPFLYAAGSHNGCGCGFQFDGYVNDDGDYVSRDTPEAVASRQGFVDFLTAALKFQSQVEVLTCCSGDELEPPKCRRQARPIDFQLDTTLFRLWDLVVVSEPDPKIHGARVVK
jgi:hypothetical protein